MSASASVPVSVSFSAAVMTQANLKDYNSQQLANTVRAIPGSASPSSTSSNGCTVEQASGAATTSA
eukprot:797903-Karenia_brevis.AAC.1